MTSGRRVGRSRKCHGEPRLEKDLCWVSGGAFACGRCTDRHTISGVRLTEALAVDSIKKFLAALSRG